VPGNHRPPGTDVVDEARAFGVDHVRAFGAVDEAGTPPTWRNARTGGTPPGMVRWARSKSWALLGMVVNVAQKGKKTPPGMGG
jgi:hypothetical protein